MKMIVSIALLCAIVVASTEACDICSKEMAPVCGQELAAPTTFEWFNSKCILEKCNTGFVLVDISNCDPSKNPAGTPLQ